MPTVQRLLRMTEQVLTGLAALCLAVMTGLVVAQVALRYGMNTSSSYTEELARYAMIWMALFAAAVGVREASHIRIDFVPELLSRLAPRLHRALRFALDLVSLTVFLVLIWYGFDATMFAMGERSPGLQIALGFPYAAVPVAFAFAAVFALARLISASDNTP
jgi:TRAP-type C4-dicarboxylate transport system permease small subunit